jgi:hypothetical protein
MSLHEHTLPVEFAELISFVSEWALSTEAARAAKRVHTPMQELQQFHATLFPRLDAIVKFLNRYPNDPDALPIDVKNLYDLALMAMEAAAPIDLGWSSTDIEDVFPLQRFKFHPL